MNLVIEINAQTGEVVERSMTQAERDQRAADEAAAKAAAAAEIHRQSLVASARAKVAEASGLSTEEMAALGF